jgi:PD-(D/E)XK nuclease superfamily
MVPVLLSEMMMPPWSYSHLNAYRQCPRKYHHYYVLKDVPYESSPQMDRGNYVHQAFEQHINKGVVLPDDLRHYEKFVPWTYKLEAEVKLGILWDGTPCDFWDKEVYGRGTADVIVEQPRSPNVSVLLDWKTGKRREDPDELATQAILLRAHRPDIHTVYGYYVWLGDDALGARHDLTDTSRKLESIRVEADAIGHQLKMGYMPPKQSPLCGWCKVKSCEFNPQRT